MGTSSLLKSGVLASVFGLLFANLLAGIAVFVWFWMAAFITFMAGPKGDLVWSYLKPLFVITLLYMPFLARFIAFYLSRDRETARTTLLIGLAAALIETWWVFLNLI